MILQNISSFLSAGRKRAVGNAIYGIADYLILPIAMLLTAPFLLRHLGAAEYGVWILASAAVSSGGIISGSSGDAIIRCVGMRRGRHDLSGIQRIVRNMLSINIILSGFIAGVLWCLAPYVARHVVKVDLDLQTVCTESLRIGSALLLVKSVEGVFVSTLRAFETYKSTVCISICSRAATIASAVIVTLYRGNVMWIMIVTLRHLELRSAGTGCSTSKQDRKILLSAILAWRDSIRDNAIWNVRLVTSCIWDTV